MQLTLATILSTVLLASGCSPLPGWIEPTVEEQAYLAELIFVGVVRNIASTPRLTSAEVDVDRFLCGCGPSRMSVSGLHGTSTCGPGIPQVGDTHIFFTCSKAASVGDSNGDALKVTINDFTLHTGMVKYGKWAEEIITATQGCRVRTPDECVNANEDNRTACQTDRALYVAHQQLHQPSRREL
eukprot:m.1129568 g.1129568  ORF g.1129568 m.1129568 type:complete len:184 (-) comp24420_c0_seq10:1422-1973(-)